MKNDIKLTREQADFLKSHYIYNGYFRAATLEALRNTYPDLYDQLLLISKTRPNIIQNIKKLLNVGEEQDPKCVICGKPALWNKSFKCYRPTCGTECGRILSSNNKDKTLLNEKGVINPSQLESSKLKRHQTTYNRIVNRLYPNFTPLFNVNDWKGSVEKYLDENNKKRVRDIKYPVRCNRCGSEFEATLGYHAGRGNLRNTRIPYCPNCDKKLSGTSKAEKEILEEIQKYYKGPIRTSARSVIRDYKIRELDLYIPEKNLATEYNGLLWHSDKEVYKDKSAFDINYHLNKTLLCLDKNIKLLHIFEDEWKFKKDIVISILKHNLDSKRKIDGNYFIRELELEESMKFFNKTNLFGFKPFDICYGLIFNNQIISAISFKMNECWEFSQFSQNLNFEIDNSFNVLFCEATKYLKGKIVVEIDRRLFTGEDIETLNKIYKIKKSFTPPRVFYTDSYNRSAEPIYKNKIYDCGTIKYELYIGSC